MDDDDIDWLLTDAMTRCSGLWTAVNIGVFDQCEGADVVLSECRKYLEEITQSLASRGSPTTGRE